VRASGRVKNPLPATLGQAVSCARAAPQAATAASVHASLFIRRAIVPRPRTLC
jgi:hypothetical protein